jgi:hypothetical protein
MLRILDRRVLVHFIAMLFEASGSNHVIGVWLVDSDNNPNVQSLVDGGVLDIMVKLVHSRNTTLRLNGIWAFMVSIAALMSSSSSAS